MSDKSSVETAERGTRTLQLLVGDELFKFTSFTQWVNKGASWYCTCGYPTEWIISIDAKGRICRTGKHFMVARDEDAFPITVHLIRGDV